MYMCLHPSGDTRADHQILSCIKKLINGMFQHFFEPIEQ